MGLEDDTFSAQQSHKHINEFASPSTYWDETKNKTKQNKTKTSRSIVLFGPLIYIHFWTHSLHIISQLPLNPFTSQTLPLLNIATTYALISCLFRCC